MSMMQRQEERPRALRNVPAFQNLRTGSLASRLAGSNHVQPVGEGHRNVIELMGLDTTGAHSDQTLTPPRQPSPYLENQPESRLMRDGEDESETPIDHPSTTSTQRSLNSSGERIRDQAFSSGTIWRQIWLPLLWIHGSMLLVLALLAVLVSVYRVKPVKGLFFEPTGWSHSKQGAYILLSIPATWLTFVTARASQFATLLAGPLMQLWTWRTAQSMIQASEASVEELPTTYQLSLLIGICMASFDKLRRWTSYRSFRQQRRKAPRSPRLLVQAGLMLYLCFFMATLMFAGDTLVHYTTETVEYHQVKESSAVQAFGRGLSQQCLSMDRKANSGFPCTVNSLISENDFLRQQNEMLYLLHNSSQTSEIRVVAANGSDIAFLLPKTQDLSPYIDYRASTIGITTKCRPISHLCNFAVWELDQRYSAFSCSSKFWGVLGKPISNTSDSEVPALALKINANLLIAFFTDESLTEPYNTVGYNPDTGLPDANIPMWPDETLINEIYVAFAARFASTAMRADTDLSMDGGFFKGPNNVYDITMSCSYKSFLIDYTWFNSTIRDLEITPAPNGTISEIWHGRHARSSVSGESPTLQTILKQAAVQDSSVGFAQTWANLYSPVVMATVGGVTSGRANSLEQIRTPILVVKVWIPALAFLAFCCLSFITAGCVFTVFTVKTAARGDIRDAQVKFSLFGIVAWAAFLALSGGQEDPEETLIDEQNVKEENQVVGILKGPKDNFYFKVFNDNNGVSG